VFWFLLFRRPVAVGESKRLYDDEGFTTVVRQKIGMCMSLVGWFTCGAIGGHSIGADIEEVAREYTRFFRSIGEIDIVTSDVAAGLALVRFEQRVL
jgi:hypothetical protein